MVFAVGHGAALRAEASGGRAFGAGGVGALADAARGGPGAGGALVARRRDGHGDRPPARRARRHGAHVARLVPPPRRRRAAGAAALGATGHARGRRACLRDDDPCRTRRHGGVDLAAAGRRDHAADRRDGLDRALERAVAAKGGFAWRRPRHTLKGRQDADAVARAGVRLALRRQQARAGEIDLLFADESEALTHPYLAHAWAKRGADLRIEAPGQAKKRALLGAVDHATGRLLVETSATKRSADFIALLGTLERAYAPQPGKPNRAVVLVLDNGPIHTSKATTKALAARSSWLTVEWLPKYAPELNDIERSWRDLKRHRLANRTFESADHLDQEIHRAVHDLNRERTKFMCSDLRRAA